MTTAFTRTREQLADSVLRKLGVLIPGAATDSASQAIVIEAIDMWLKQAHREGIFWRKVTNKPVTYSLNAAVATASIGAGDILFPIKLTINDGSLDQPVDIISYRDYHSIANKALSGPPTKAVWNGAAEFTFWPVPETSGIGKLTYEKIADDTSAGTAIDADVAMMPWVRDIIAYRVADDFEVDNAMVTRFAQEAMYAEKQIKKLSSPRVSYEPVYVDQWTSRTSRIPKDYNP